MAWEELNASNIFFFTLHPWINSAISDQSVSGGVHADKEGLAAHTEQIIALLLKSSIWRERTL